MARPKQRPEERRLAPAEWQIMRICWRLGRANVRQILAEDRKSRRRDYRTILTFVSRMEKKGYLSVEKEGRTNFYTPAVSPQRGLREEIHRFLKDVVGPERENLELLERELKSRLRRRKRK